MKDEMKFGSKELGKSMNKNYKRCINCKHFSLVFEHFKLKRYVCTLPEEPMPILMKEARTLCCGNWELKE